MSFSDDELEAVKNASPEQHATILGHMQAGHDPDTLKTLVRGELGIDPVGNDAMVATATGMGLQEQLDVAGSMAANGQTTITAKDIEILKGRVESLVKDMVAKGASDTEIQQAVSGMASTPELASIAKEAAQQQLDTEKFNLFSSRGNQQEQGGADLLTEIGKTLKDMGRTGEALANAGSTGFVSGPGTIPDVRVPGLGIGNAIG